LLPLNGIRESRNDWEVNIFEEIERREIEAGLKKVTLFHLGRLSKKGGILNKFLVPFLALFVVSAIFDPKFIEPPVLLYRAVLRTILPLPAQIQGERHKDHKGFADYFTYPRATALRVWIGQVGEV
jgi:hypothetical protein